MESPRRRLPGTPQASPHLFLPEPPRGVSSSTVSGLASNGVTFTVPPSPSVTINQAAAQVDPTNASTINFTAVFSAAVTGFSSTGVTLGGTAGATTAVVTGSGTTYNVAVSGMTQTGTVNRFHSRRCSHCEWSAEQGFHQHR